MEFYILDDQRRVNMITDLLQWALWYERACRDGTRIVGRFEHNGIEVSTVFLGIDHGFGGVPMLFETMVFGGPDDQACWRFSTWAEAEAHHMATCRKVRAQQQDSDEPTQRGEIDETN